MADIAHRIAGIAHQIAGIAYQIAGIAYRMAVRKTMIYIEGDFLFWLKLNRGSLGYGPHFNYHDDQGYLKLSRTDGSSQ